MLSEDAKKEYRRTYIEWLKVRSSLPAQGNWCRRWHFILDPMSIPSMSPGILLSEEFVTKSVLDARLQNAREETETLSNVRFAKSLTCLRM